MKRTTLMILALAACAAAALAVTQQAYIIPKPGDRAAAFAADHRLDILRIDRAGRVEVLADGAVIDEYRLRGYAIEIKHVDAGAYYRQVKQTKLRYDFGPFYTYAEANQRMDSLHLIVPHVRCSQGVDRRQPPGPSDLRFRGHQCAHQPSRLADHRPDPRPRTLWLQHEH